MPVSVHQTSTKLLNEELNCPTTSQSRRREIRDELKRRKDQQLIALFNGGKMTALTALQQIIRHKFPDLEDCPTTLTQCRKQLQRHHINIYDFLEWLTGEVDSLYTCRSNAALYNRCRKKGFFPLDEAKHAPELKVLLEVLLKN